MNFTEAVNEVMSIVKRQDKLLDIRREVNAAVRNFCMDTEFTFDLAELSPGIVGTELTQAIALSSFARFRKFQYIKRGGTRTFLSPLARNELLTTACDFRNKYYIAGVNVNISLADYSTTLDIAWFQHPPVLTDAAPDFWMLDKSPYMVIDKAASKIFNNIGDPASANYHSASAREAFLIAAKDYGISTQ